jgi:hypothetical protein
MEGVLQDSRVDLRRVTYRLFLVCALAGLVTWWWFWSNSVIVTLSVDTQSYYCVDGVSMSVAPVGRDGHVRLCVSRHDKIALLDVVSESGASRARISCMRGYFWFSRPIICSIESASGPGEFVMGDGFNELRLHSRSARKQ